MTRERFPMNPFPHGWYAVELSRDLKHGETRPLHYFGQDLVLFRDEDGAAHLLDAFCPHLGTHLGHGGKVIGKTIKCPFHGWRFDGAGTCVEIPYCDRVPENVASALRAWPVREYGGMLLTYWHHDSKTPDWEIPGIIPFGCDGWSQPEWKVWQVRSHPQDVLENSVDIHHFCNLHEMPPAEYVEATEKGPILEVANKFFGGPRGRAGMTASVHVTVAGMGLSLARSHREGVEGFVLSAVTPIDGESVDVRIGISVRLLNGSGDREKEMRALVDATFGNVEQDKVIWGNKVCYDKPRLMKSERGILVYRAWVRQFYPTTRRRDSSEA